LKKIYIPQRKICASVKRFKANQILEAILRTLNAEGERAKEIKLRLKRLYAADRSLGRRSRSSDEADRLYAFYTDDPPGTGADILFTEYDAFASLAAIMLLEHGLPQLAVVRLLRLVRRKLERIHAENLEKDPKKLFDEKALIAQAKPGMIAFGSTDPVILAFVGLTGSSVEDPKLGPAFCVDAPQLPWFMKEHNIPGTGITIFDFSRLIHVLEHNLLQTRAVKRGRPKYAE
jgi:hypothetical protein